MKTNKRISLLFLAILASFVFQNCKHKINLNPTIEFIGLGTNISLLTDTTFIFKTKVVDDDGVIEKVDFYIDNVLVKSVDKAAFEFEWKPSYQDIGNHILKAIAYDNHDAKGTAERQFQVNDFRTNYFGNFDFTVIIESWAMNLPTTYDTFHYPGVIREYILSDSDDDFYSHDDSDENPHQKITIGFLQGAKITSLINLKGELIPKMGIHYHHQGKFVTIDSIAFSIGGLGGLGGGWNYMVNGIRK